MGIFMKNSSWIKKSMGRQAAKDSVEQPVSSRKKGYFASRNKSRQLGLLASGWMIIQTVMLGTPALAKLEPNTLTYGELLQKIEANEVSKVTIDPAARVAKVKLEGKNQSATEQQ